ncbi:hypothetical protein A8B75_18170 [Sphingomonadales bacterium EhC05]|nr:hypothetical protein A8B75_18170 [Sphingomonadales bacterium EhC05]
MPKIFEWQGYRFYFYSNEGNPREPVHVHVRKARDTAKFWIRPEISVAYNRGFSSNVLSRLIAVIEGRGDEIERQWHDFFSP